MVRFENESDRRAWRAYAQSALAAVIGGSGSGLMVPPAIVGTAAEQAAAFADAMLEEERDRRG